MASPLTTELAAFYDPVDFATDKSLIIDLTNRVADFDTQLPGTAKASHAMTTAVFEEFCRLLAVAQDVSVGLGIDINATITHSSGEVIPLYDFTFPTYTEFEQQVQVAIADIEAQPVEEEAEPRHAELTAAVQEDTNVVLTKLLVALGLNEARKAILDTLDDIAPELMGSIGDAIKKRNWRVLRRLLTKLLQLRVSKRFRDALAARVGERTAAKIVGKVAARFIPVVSWAVLIGSVIWAFAEELL